MIPANFMITLNYLRKTIFGKALFFLPSLLIAWLATAQTNSATADHFSFIAAGDMRNYVAPLSPRKRQFDGLCEAAAKLGAGEFMISPGDCDPPGPVRATIDLYLGTNYVWYPVIGNHDADTAEDMAWVHHWAEAGFPTSSGPAPRARSIRFTPSISAIRISWP